MSRKQRACLENSSVVVQKYYRNSRIYAIKPYIIKQFNKIKLAEVNVKTGKSPQEKTKMKYQAFTL